MKITFLTKTPEVYEGLLKEAVIMHAIQKEIAEIEVIDIKEYAGGSFRHIDDSPYGGGAGMILKVEPMLKALSAIKQENSYTIAVTPAGFPYTQKKAHELSKKEHLIILCGQYEGMDERIYSACDERLSIGDFIVTGGELPSMMIADSIIRLLDGVLRKESTQEESFEDGLLEYPQYTRPAEYAGMKVPDVLLSGNHEEIEKWKKKEALRITLQYRPDLMKDIKE